MSPLKFEKRNIKLSQIFETINRIYHLLLETFEINSSSQAYFCRIRKKLAKFICAVLFDERRLKFGD